MILSRSIVSLNNINACILSYGVFEARTKHLNIIKMVRHTAFLRQDIIILSKHHHILQDTHWNTVTIMMFMARNCSNNQWKPATKQESPPAAH
jgi:hypothetical protein